MIRQLLSAFIVSVLFTWSTIVSAEVATVREATAAGPGGNAAAGILGTVDAFRTDLGNPLNGSAVGDQGAGRRDINWDGVPDADSAASRFPPDFFNSVAPRGAIFFGEDGNPRISFQVSADAVNPAASAVEFGNLNATYPTAFSVFSSERLFTPLGFNVLEVRFFEAGSNTPATVTGFGAVFSDVDLASTTKIEYFDANGVELISRDVLATAGNESLSFLGVSFTTRELARVKITLGNGILGPNDISQGGPSDLVVLDDLIYGEPGVAVPPAPLITSPTDGSTVTTALPTIAGVAAAGSTVEVFDGGASLGTTAPTADGTWSLMPGKPLNEGDHAITARATNSAGTGAASGATDITVDVLAANSPTKATIAKANRIITMQMDNDPTAVAYLVTTKCLRKGRVANTSQFFFENPAVFPKPRGKRCRFQYRVIANGEASGLSPRAK